MVDSVYSPGGGGQQLQIRGEEGVSLTRRHYLSLKYLFRGSSLTTCGKL